MAGETTPETDRDGEVRLCRRPTRLSGPEERERYCSQLLARALQAHEVAARCEGRGKSGETLRRLGQRAARQSLRLLRHRASPSGMGGRRGQHA